jgi:hypothetical protein
MFNSSGKSKRDPTSGVLSTKQRRRIATWRKRICAAWQKHVSAIIETGKLLIASHDDLISVHGAWATMVEDLPFDRTVAHRLMAVARNEVLSNVAYTQRLPAEASTSLAVERLGSLSEIRFGKSRGPGANSEALCF